MKPIILTLTLKRLLLFGIPILAFVLSLFVGLTFKANGLKKENDKMKENMTFFASHPISFLGEISTIRPLQEGPNKYAFSALGWYKNERVVYVCTSTRNSPRAKQRIALYRHRAASGGSRDFLVSGQSDGSGVTTTKEGSLGIFLKDCIVLY
ncbi:MAG: hypothetical protein OXH16_03130 [Gemmatimonadetes bacterium]|nr:hypothetical protein [Gemmatimonadota bacterium]